MKTFKESLNKKLENPEFKKIWEASKFEKEIVSKMIDDLYDKKTSIENISKLSSIPSSRLYEIEEGEPLFATELVLLAEAMGYKFQLSYT